MNSSVLLLLLLLATGILLLCPTIDAFSPSCHSTLCQVNCQLSTTRYYSGNSEGDHTSTGIENDLSVRTMAKAEHSESPPYFEPLDVMLERARKRKMVLLPYRIQALTNKPIVRLGSYAALTAGDTILILVAIKLGSIGFSVGYVLGKGTKKMVQRKNISLAELWVVGLAVGADILWNNIIF
mmetsp:Transcript_6771/g.9941  ORF Transcript_6771/g.9941 Transcript_6771/m.9941 type:complete len:182 (+) Transcript_6771:85-630(+)